MIAQYVFFIIMTLIYFFAPFIGKKVPNIETLSIYDVDKIHLTAFVLIVILSQFLLNTLDLTRMCESSFLSNIKRGFGLTFIPWIFVFGVTVLMIYFYPRIKCMFSNVIGYIFVSGQAYDFFNRVIADNVSIKQEILSNISSVLNEMDVETFETVIEKMTPVMTLGEEGDVQELLNIVSLKENIGEMCWYLFAGILSILMSSYSLAKKGCVEDIAYIRKLQERISKDRKSKKN
jgi:hypothetical protein